MESELIELSRSRNGYDITETKAILEAANIPYRVGSTATNFDITTIGSGSDAEVILSVMRSDFSAARAAMENEYLKVELPSDHYLLTSTDDELAEILGKPAEWSPFDVAHARKLAEARSISSDYIEKKNQQRMEMLRRGKPASRTLLFFGWLSSLLGGLIGLGIAWSICFMKERVPEGDFFTYDEKSRALAKPMFRVACIMTCLILFLRINGFLSF